MSQLPGGQKGCLGGPGDLGGSRVTPRESDGLRGKPRGLRGSRGSRGSPWGQG